MTKLDLVLERIRKLPEDRQEALALEMEFWLDFDACEDSLPLSQEQEAELARRLADPETKYVSHEEVGAYFEQKYGR